TAQRTRSPGSATTGATSSGSCRTPSTPSTPTPAPPGASRCSSRSSNGPSSGSADSVAETTVAPFDSEPLHRSLGLTDEEYDRVVETLGREPNRAELAMYSVMWSEHCSYKSSAVHLRKLPTEGPAVLVGPGEDAGVVDLGDGLAAVFKLESHSHPSAVE